MWLFRPLSNVGASNASFHGPTLTGSYDPLPRNNYGIYGTCFHKGGFSCPDRRYKDSIMQISASHSPIKTLNVALLKRGRTGTRQLWIRAPLANRRGYCALAACAVKLYNVTRCSNRVVVLRIVMVLKTRFLNAKSPLICPCNNHRN
jgi:hypothetical protein